MAAEVGGVAEWGDGLGDACRPDACLSDVCVPAACLSGACLSALCDPYLCASPEAPCVCLGVSSIISGRGWDGVRREGDLGALRMLARDAAHCGLVDMCGTCVGLPSSPVGLLLRTSSSCDVMRAI